MASAGAGRVRRIRAGATMDGMALHITDDAPADALLTDSPLALLVGMLLEKQIS